MAVRTGQTLRSILYVRNCGLKNNERRYYTYNPPPHTYTAIPRSGGTLTVKKNIPTMSLLQIHTYPLPTHTPSTHTHTRARKLHAN